MSRREALTALAVGGALGSTSVTAGMNVDPHARLYDEAKAAEIASLEATGSADEILFALPPGLRQLADRLNHQQISEEEKKSLRTTLAATGYPAARDKEEETRSRFRELETELYTTRATTLPGLLVQARALAEDLDWYGGITDDESDVAAAKNIVATLESLLPKMRSAA